MRLSICRIERKGRSPIGADCLRLSDPGSKVVIADAPLNVFPSPLSKLDFRLANLDST
jgi:hypothetical protein